MAEIKKRAPCCFCVEPATVRAVLHFPLNTALCWGCSSACHSGRMDFYDCLSNRCSVQTLLWEGCHTRLPGSPCGDFANQHWGGGRCQTLLHTRLYPSPPTRGTASPHIYIRASPHTQGKASPHVHPWDGISSHLYLSTTHTWWMASPYHLDMGQMSWYQCSGGFKLVLVWKPGPFSPFPRFEGAAGRQELERH